jgi:polygalacturonase
VSEDSKSKTFEDQFNDFCYNFFMHFFKEYAEIIDFFYNTHTDFFSWPEFPLNTDGIDIAGSNVLVENVKITTWDDGVVVKPSHNTDRVARDGCSQYIKIQHVKTMFTIGAAVGSVPPHETHACVRRVHFFDYNLTLPVKGIYVKTNPGYKGSGEIRDIMYENINMYFPLWFGVYIGP